MSTQFDSFIESIKQENSTAPTIDWEREKQEWLSYLDGFYADIERYLVAYIDDKTVRLTKRSIKIHEEYIGEYEVDELILTLGKETVYFTPKGMNLIGVRGRVDMRSSKGTVRFVLVPESASKPSYSLIDTPQSQSNDDTKNNWVWKIATPPTPKIRYISISQDSFQEALLEVVNG